MEKIQDFMGNFSKKLTLAITSVLLIVLTEGLGMDISFEKLVGIVGIVVSYIIGQSVVDAKKG